MMVRTCLNTGDLVKQLRDFLDLKKVRFELIYEYDTGGVIKKIQIKDVNRDGSQEICAFAHKKYFHVFVSVTNQKDNYSEFHIPVCCENFCIYLNLERSLDSVMLAETHDRNKVLKDYLITRPLVDKIDFDNQVFSYNLKEHEEILDIVYKRNNFYIATDKQQVYQLDAIAREIKENSVPHPIIKFFTGGEKAEKSINDIMHSRLIALTVDSWLMVLDIKFGDFRIIKKKEIDYQLLDAFIIDIDGDDDCEIVACSRNGMLLIYDLDTLNVKYQYNCYDEFFCIYCEDIMNDKKIDIIVGGTNGILYILGIYGDTLKIKWQYQCEHQIYSIRVLNNRNIVLGLGNGKMQILHYHDPQHIDNQIRKLLEKIKKNVKGDVLQWLTSNYKYDNIYLFALEKVNSEETVIKILDYIRNCPNHTTKMMTLDKLAFVFKKFEKADEIVNSLIDYIEDLFKNFPNMIIKEKIYFTLEEIKKVSSNEEIYNLAKRNNDLIHKLKVPRINRIEYVRECIKKGELKEAEKELDVFVAMGCDLITTYVLDAGVFTLYYQDPGDQIVTIDKKNRISVFHKDDGSVKQITYSGSDLIYLYCPYSEYENMIFHQKKIDIFNDKWEEKETLAEIPAEITCAVLIALGKEVQWIMGLKNGQLIIRGLTEIYASFKLNETPDKIIKVNEGNLTHFYILTSSSCVVTVKQQADKSYQIEAPGVFLFNNKHDTIVDFISIGNNLDKNFLLVLKSELVFIGLEDKPLKIKSIKPKHRINAAIYCPQKQQAVHDKIIIATDNRTLVFYSLDGNEEQTIYLPYVPTAIFCIASKNDFFDLLVGYRQGPFHRYQIFSEETVLKLRNDCSLTKWYSQVWDQAPMEKKFLLKILAAGNDMTVSRIYEALNYKVKFFITEAMITTAASELEERKILENHIKSGMVVYSIKDELFRELIKNSVDDFKILRENRDSIIKQLKMIDIFLIDKTLNDKNEPGWFYSFMSIEKDKWENLVFLAKKISELNDNTSCEIDAISLDIIKKISNYIRTDLITNRSYQVKKSEFYSAFEMRFPSISFRGFDKILTLVTKKGMQTEFEALFAQDEKVSPLILLCITFSNKKFMRNILEKGIHETVIFDEMDLKEILLSPDPHKEFLDRFIPQLNLSSLTPFQIKGAVKGNMFYGRKHALTTIMNSLRKRDCKNIAIIGPRRIGKSSLMLKIEEEAKKEKKLYPIFISCISRETKIDLYRAILMKMKITKECKTQTDFISSIFDFCQANKNKQLVLLLDEIDAFIENKNNEDDKQSFSSTIRALINEINVKVVIAGYTELYFEMEKADKGAFFNLHEPLELSQIERESARKLISDALQDIYEIKDQNIEIILDKTGCFPSYIQACCKYIVEAQKESQKYEKTNERSINRRQIIDVVNSTQYYDFVIKAYLENIDLMTKFIIYILIHHYDNQTGLIIIKPGEYIQAKNSAYYNADKKYEIGWKMTPYLIRDLLETFVKLTDKDLTYRMQRLVLSSILKKNDDGSYQFVLPDFPQLMRKHKEIDVSCVNLWMEIEKKYGGIKR